MQQRDYQDQHLDGIMEDLSKYRRVLGQMPTGGGKTVEFCRLVKYFIEGYVGGIEKGPTLIVVHRIELLHQAARTAREILGFNPCLITSDTDSFQVSRCYIGMAKSVMNRLHLFIDPSLIIVDEAHLQDFIKIHKQFPRTKILGWTATPKSVTSRTPLKDFYETIRCGPQIKELIAQGYLSQNVTYAPENGINLQGFQYDKLIGDYNQKQVYSQFSMSNNIENVIHKYWDYCLKKKTLVFNVNINHSKEVCRYFNVMGIPCKHLDADSPDRAEIFEWFKQTPEAVLCSVMIPTMGFDEPTVQAVILNFSTTSIVKFIQCCGRGSRIIDDYFIEEKQKNYKYPLSLKDRFIILDLGSNWLNFGDWNDDRDWKRIFLYPDMPGYGVAPTKVCKPCGALVHAAVRICPHCGSEFPKKKSEQMDMERMILVTKGVDSEILNKFGDKTHKYYPFFSMAIDVVETLWATYGNKSSQSTVDRFFRVYYNMCCEWYKKTLGTKEDMMESIEDSSWHISQAKKNFNALIRRKDTLMPVVGSNEKDILDPDYPQNVRQRDKDWNNLKSEVL